MKKLFLLLAAGAALAIPAKAQIINIEFGGNSYAPGQYSAIQTNGGILDPSATGDNWNFTGGEAEYNSYTSVSGYNLLYTNGTSSGAVLTTSGVTGTYSVGSGGSGVPLQSTNYANLYQGSISANNAANTATLTISNLTNGTYNLVLYQAPNQSNRDFIDTAGGQTLYANPTPTSTQTMLAGGTTPASGINATYVEFQNVLVTSGTLQFTFGSQALPGHTDNEADLNGFSLQLVGSPVPEPSTYAFMGLGLILAFFLSRTRRSAANV